MTFLQGTLRGVNVTYNAINTIVLSLVGEQWLIIVSHHSLFTIHESNSNHRLPKKFCFGFGGSSSSLEQDSMFEVEATLG